MEVRRRKKSERESTQKRGHEEWDGRV